MPNNEEVNTISVKAPAFMETACAGWFQIMEAQFHLRKITVDDTKFYHVLSSLPAETVARIDSTTLSEKKYETLKNEIVAMYEKTKPELFDKLTSSTPMTGRPSLYLEEIRKTASKLGVGDDLVRHKFIQSLPPAISPVLAAQKDIAIGQIGKLADELMPFAQTQSQVFMAQPSTSPNHNNGYQQQKHQGQQQHYKDQQTIPFGLRPFNSSQRQQVCRSHIFFGTKARTCKPWCKWPNKSQCDVQASSRPSSRNSSPIPENH